MEIDFLGLNSKDSSYKLVKNQSSLVNPFTDSGGTDVSLSLRTTSPLDSRTDQLPYFNKTNTWRFSSTSNYSPENAPTMELQAYTASVPNKIQSDRNIQENSGHPLLTILCPASPYDHIYAQKVDSYTKIVGNASPDKPRKCYTPTVAMARRATLVRFLQKRSHRLNQTRIANLMGIPLNVSEAAHIKCNNKKKNMASFMV